LKETLTVLAPGEPAKPEPGNDYSDDGESEEPGEDYSDNGYTIYIQYFSRYFYFGNTSFKETFIHQQETCLWCTQACPRKMRLQRRLFIIC